MADWSQLNHDVLDQISSRIPSYKDFVAFRGVCTCWRRAADLEKHIKSNTRFQTPLLMFPSPTTTTACTGNTDLFRFYDQSNETIREFQLPQLYNKRCCLSSKGWLLTILKKEWSMSLFNPFSGSEIQLPHLKTFQDWKDLSTPMMYALFVYRFVLSSSPSDDDDYTVMVIYGGIKKLAYYKASRGDQVWIAIAECHHCFEDVTYYKGRFYVINAGGTIRACDLGGDNPKVEQVGEAPNGLLPKIMNHCFYIVESAGTLLVVIRYGVYPQFDADNVSEESEDEDEEHEDEYEYERHGLVIGYEPDIIYIGSEDEDLQESDDFTYGTFKFQVFEVDLSTNTWKETKDVGNRALFLGHNSSLSVEATDVFRCKPNCIYFTDDCIEAYMKYPGGGGKDMGLYNIKDGSIKPYFSNKPFDRINPPSWLERSKC